MTTKSDDVAGENEMVSRNVRRFRQERAMSLGELARRSGLSKQTLSKIEQAEGNPTVETLARLGHALDVSVRRLLTEWGTPVFVQLHGDGRWSQHGALAERLLDETYGSGYVRTLFLKLQRSNGPGGESVGPHSPGTLHHLFVITGKMRAGPLSEPVDLSAGDFVRFPGDVDHVITCLTERASAHMVTTVPQVRQFGPTVADSGQR